MPELTRIYDVALLDLDGVVYIGEHLVEHASRALSSARGTGMRLAFVTNNASRTAEDVAAHLVALGVQAAASEVVTSAQAAARMLADQLRPEAKVLVVGGDGLEAALRERDLHPVRTLADEPAAVVQGFAPSVDWRALAEGAYAVAAGLPWVATNVDSTLPTPRGRAPGNGTLVDAVRAASGREPVVAGKPEPPMHREAIVRSGARRPLVVGDRLDTDIEGATAAGVDSLLVFTGVTDPLDLVLAPPRLRPTFVGADLRALHHTPDSLAVGEGQSDTGGWKAVVDGDELHLRHDEAAASRTSTAGDIDALRAVCAAVWAGESVSAATIRDALANAGWADMDARSA